MAIEVQFRRRYVDLRSRDRDHSLSGCHHLTLTPAPPDHLQFGLDSTGLTRQDSVPQVNTEGDPMKLMSLTVNGTERSLEVEPRTLLVHALRDQLGLTGTNIGCDSSSCGACTILVDGRSAKSCTMLAVQADGADVTTIEGLAGADGTLHPVQQAFHECHALQCGYCTPGMVMAAVSLIDEYPDLDEVGVRSGLEGNLCRCTGYQNIVDAVLQAVGNSAEARRAATVPAENRS